VKQLLTLFLLLSSCVALADADSGSYINLNTGVAKLYNLPTGEWTGNLNAGYNFSPYFALEGGYNLFAGSQFGVTTSTSIFDVAAKGTLPLSDIFSIYGRAGLGFGMNAWSGTLTNSANCILCNNSINNNYGLGLVGLGVSFTLSKHFDLRVEDTAYLPFQNTTTGAINAVTGGVQYNF
jgi:opacity protein-like surface antigen